VETVEIDWRVGTAVHEMGHALLRSLAGLVVTSVTIQKAFLSSQFSGETCWTMPKSYGEKLQYVIDWEDLKILCYGCLAGQEAESLWLSRTYGFSISEARGITRPGSGTDMNNYRNIAQHLEDFSEAGARLETDKIILRNWPVIELLADILSDRERLNTRMVSRHISAGSDSGVRVIQPKLYDPATAGSS
jgi:hypothetical protein